MQPSVPGKLVTWSLALLVLAGVPVARLARSSDKFGRESEVIRSENSVAVAIDHPTTPGDATERIVYDARDLGTFNGAVVGQDWQLELIDALRQTVAPATWDSAGGEGAVAAFEGALIVTQSPAAHEEINLVLTGIRRARSPHSGDHVDLRPVTAALDRPVSVDLEDSLEGAVSQIGIAGRIDVALDAATLAAAGHDPQATVVCRAEGSPVRDVLAQLLEPLDLTWVESEQGLIVTTSAVADADRFPRVYDIRDLAGVDFDGVEPWAELVALIQTIVAPDTWDESGNAAIAPISGAVIVRQGRRQHDEIAALLSALRRMQDDPAAISATVTPTVRLYRLPATVADELQPPPDLNALRTALMTTVARESWDQLGGTGSILVLGELLVVRQSPGIQEQVADVLEQLARVRTGAPH